MQAHDPAPGATPIRAAQYVRMSTEHQQYSIENQSVSIANYAGTHRMQVVRTYADEGKSGLTLQSRAGLRRLLQDADSGAADFSVILVYDVSRWGRFQDVDESAYYEYCCRRANIRVHYCAEPFANDGSISSALLKTIKRSMAGEFSRELSAKVFAGKSRLIEHGFRQGGHAGYGFRRLLVDREGNSRCVLKYGESKSISTDRVILVPGPDAEVQIVQEMYRQFIDEDWSMPAIRDSLNQRGIANEYGGRWTRDMVSNVLTNPKYMGANVSNRKSFKLRVTRIRNPPEMWVRRDGAFEPIVTVERFQKAQEVLSARNRRYTDDELLELLKRLRARVGLLSGRVIDHAGGIPKTRVFEKRFGGLLAAYRRIGYEPPGNYSHLSTTAALEARFETEITALVAYLSGAGATVVRDPVTDLLTINDELRVSFQLVRCHHQNPRSQNMWRYRFDSPAPWDIMVAARMAPGNDSILDYYLVPRSERMRPRVQIGAAFSFLDIHRFNDLSILESLIRRTQL
jgi:DNA invertase Pin-like site-specific DNA recombinase